MGKNLTKPYENLDPNSSSNLSGTNISFISLLLKCVQLSFLFLFFYQHFQSASLSAVTRQQNNIALHAHPAITDIIPYFCRVSQRK